MSVCTFFGHRDVSDNIKPQLTNVVRRLIEQDGVTKFYIGNHGNFDRLAKRVVQQLAEEYPYIRFSVVLSRLPQGEWCRPQDGQNTVFPEEVAKAMPRYAILARNRWMLDRADVVVTYVTHSFGGSGRFKRLAEQKDKRVVNLPDLLPM